MPRTRRDWTLLFLFAGLLLVAGGLPDYVAHLAYAAESGRRQALRDTDAALDLRTAFRDVARRAGPSVVSISVTRGGPATGGLFDGLLESPPRTSAPRPSGTGFLIGPDGHVVTNDHVVRGATGVWVSLSDRRTLVARVVGTDPASDLAVLEVEGDALMGLEWGDSDALEVGDWVTAIGNPFGLDHTVTAGIVSAKGRADLAMAEFEEYLQTDAAINPGNSGGPLLDLDGRVVGINSAMATQTGASSGIGFAIPSRLAQAFVRTLIERGRAVRGFLGVQLKDLSPEEAEGLRLDPVARILVVSVIEGGPAATSLRAGDVVLEYDGRALDSANHLRNLVAGTRPGRPAALGLLREGRQETVTMVIGTRP